MIIIDNIFKEVNELLALINGLLLEIKEMANILLDQSK